MRIVSPLRIIEQDAYGQMGKWGIGEMGNNTWEIGEDGEIDGEKRALMKYQNIYNGSFFSEPSSIRNHQRAL